MKNEKTNRQFGIGRSLQIKETAFINGYRQKKKSTWRTINTFSWARAKYVYKGQEIRLEKLGHLGGSVG